MPKCPLCQFANEDGALFCEQCKSDLGVLETTTPSPKVQGSERAESTAITPMPNAEASVIVNQVRPIPVATPVGSVQPSPVGVVPMATAVQPRPVPTARAGEAPLAILPEAAPTSSKEGRLEPPPTVPVPIDTSATISSLATYSAPSKAPPASSTPSPASPLTRDTDLLPIGGKARLLVLRGQKINVTYPLYDGDNFIGRADERPVDIDLEDQELPDRIWSSRQHALIRCEEGILVIEDLNSSNGTFINRTRLYPGQKRVLNVNDIIQIGTVQMRVVIDPSA